ncbi:hypothetical protein K443DRAFT_10920 [Laccaria amethystina LaAM-08-1]|uniref:Uncharacterized protein n=1 Tax=Laccaria amethystina LaAM-08-1 TaxID=1095629 RepID=A0A0C9X473_9AGAR|nr:hypothetical protein K443DRAFT_10920 [Laccaria amethystina LaAM-08-1]
MTSFTNTKPGDMNRDVSQHGSESLLRAGIYNGMLVCYYAVSLVDDFPRRFVFSLELVPRDSQGANIRWLSIQLWLGDFSLLYNTALPCCWRIARQAIERYMQLLQEHTPVFLYDFYRQGDQILGTRSFGNTARSPVTPPMARRREGGSKFSVAVNSGPVSTVLKDYQRARNPDLQLPIYGPFDSLTQTVDLHHTLGFLTYKCDHIGSSMSPMPHHQDAQSFRESGNSSEEPALMELTARSVSRECTPLRARRDTACNPTVFDYRPTGLGS